MSVLLFLVVLFILVLVHEWGHFATARFFKMPVEEFGFGFPPRAMKLFTRKGTLFTLNWLPLGGFVKITGEDPLSEEKSKDSYIFSNQPWYAQAIVLCAGVFMNFVLAWLLLSFLFMSGSPTALSEAQMSGGTITSEPQLTVVQVLPNSPAKNSGLLAGDVISRVCLSGTQTCPVQNNSTRDELIASIRNSGATQLTFDIIRAGKPLQVSITPEIKDTVSMIGIVPEQVVMQKYGFLRSFIEGFKSATFMSLMIIKTFGTLIHDAFLGKAQVENLTGPIGLVQAVGSAYTIGFSYLLSLMALVSLNLAVINLVPFPALDGGRLLFVLIEAITRKKISPKFVGILNTIGFFILIGLMVLVSVYDVGRLLK